MDASLISAIVNFSGFLIGGLVMAVTVKNNVSVLQSEVRDMKKEFKADVEKLASALTTLAVQSERLDMLDKRYEQLRHGEGFVFPLANRLRGE